MQFVINNWYLFLAVAVFVYLLLAGPVMQAVRGIKTLTVAQAVQLMNQEGALVLDVREPDEFRTGHIPHAINIPVGTLPGRLKEIEKYKDKPILLNCRTSQRSARAALMLRKQGYTTAHILGGGILAWEKDNLPMEK